MPATTRNRNKPGGQTQAAPLPLTATPVKVKIEEIEQTEQTVLSTATLLSLPAELQKSFADYVTRDSDKRNLCLVCKEMQALITPYLYQHMVISASRLTGDKHSVFTATHEGLRHVRRLRIWTIPRTKPGPQFESAFHLPGICQLLAVIPQDALHVFELPTTSLMHPDLDFLLRLRQRKLANHQYHSPLSRILNLPPSNDELSNVTSLQIYLRMMKDCQVAGSLIECVPRITNLAILMHDFVLDFPGGRCSAAGHAIVIALFDSGNTARICANLKCLRIESMCFKSAGTILPTVLTLGHLQHLQLLECRHTNRFCEALSQVKPPLQAFSDERSYNVHTRQTFGTFLKSINPLSKLRISCDRATEDLQTFGLSDLMLHAPKLLCLELDDWELSEVYRFPLTGRRALSTLDAFCERASQLEQLAIAGPELDDSEWKSPGGLDSVLACLRKLPRLRVLRLFVFSMSLDMIYGEEDEDGMHEELDDLRMARLARVAADRIFESLAEACPSFVALVLDASGASPLVEPCGFLRSKQLDLYGKTTHVGIPVPYKELKHHEPCSDILAEETLAIS